MPATATGRGAQIVIDPSSDAAKAARGAYAATMEANALKAATDMASGALATGDGSDGRTVTGTKATDLVTTPGSAGISRLLNAPVVSVGNGADLTEDTLQTVTIPAGTLRNVGDRIRITAAGAFAGSTDSKFARIRWGSISFGANGTSGATNIRWSSEAVISKTGPNTQSWATLVGNVTQGSANGGTATQNDTAAITVAITGQNTTNSVASSVTCDFLTVEYLPA